MSPATTTPAAPEKSPPNLSGEPFVEAERIPLRSALPTAAGKPLGPTETDVRNRFADMIKVDAPPKAEPKPKSRLPKDEPPKTSVPKPSKYVDRAYFPTRAMLPELTMLGCVCTAWFLGVVPLLPEWLATPEVIASVPGAYGIFVMVRWLFRVIAGGYQLTAAQLLRINAGPIPDPEPIELARIAAVQVEQTGLDWILAVGSVKLTIERDVQPEIVLGPLSWPRRRAKLIEDAMKLAREGTVTATRIAA